MLQASKFGFTSIETGAILQEMSILKENEIFDQSLIKIQK